LQASHWSFKTAVKENAMNLFKEMLDLLSTGESFVSATILSRSGSAPRSAGTRMVVRSDASILGTIGGGILEAKVQGLAAEVFQHRRPLVKKFVLSAEDASRMGMICGGQVDVLIHLVDAAVPLHLEMHRALCEALKSRKRAWLITEIPADGMDRVAVVYNLLKSSGEHVGGLEESRVQRIVALAGSREPEVVSDECRRFFVEPLCSEGSVYIFGAGHVSQKLAHLTTLVGFRTVVLDDREEFANRERFEAVDEIVVLDSFEDALQGLDLDRHSYIVLVTRGHAHDKTLLAEALRTEAGYIGMIGSRRKRDAIYDALQKEGFPAEAFERVYSPIGLNIGAETPEEIAVSIVAELIQARAGRGE
jgi:xanthine dehydrogenase accessory factor